MRCLFAITLGAIAAMATTSQAALVSHWKFDETSGLVAADSSGSVANDGTWDNGNGAGLTWVAGQVGGAAQLDGTSSDQFFSIPSGIEADNKTQLSYSMWIKANLAQAGSGGDLDNKGIFNTGNAEIERSSDGVATSTFTGQFWGATWQFQTGFRVDNTGALQQPAPPGTNGLTVYDGSETEPEWHHLVFTWDGDAGSAASGDEIVNAYIDGSLAATTSTRNVRKLIEDGAWQIGKDRNNNGRMYGGAIDDLAVWDEVLNPAAVRLVYNAGLAGIDASQAIPEPTSVVLGLLGACGFAAVAMRRRLG